MELRTAGTKFDLMQTHRQLSKPKTEIQQKLNPTCFEYRFAKLT